MFTLIRSLTLAVLATIVLSGCGGGSSNDIPVGNGGTFVVKFDSPDDIPTYAPSEEAPLVLDLTRAATAATETFCYRSSALLLGRVCINSTFATAKARFGSKVAPGNYILALEGDRPGSDSRKLIYVNEGVPFRIADPSGSGGNGKSVTASPGLYMASGQATLIIDTGNTMGSDRDYTVTGSGVTVPTKLTVPAGSSTGTILVTPSAENYIWVNVTGNGEHYKYDDLRLNGKDEPSLGTYSGSSTSFVGSKVISLSVAYTREPVYAELFGVENVLFQDVNLTYDGQTYTLKEQVGANTESSIEISTAQGKFLLVPEYGETGKIHYSVRLLRSDFSSIDEGVVDTSLQST